MLLAAVALSGIGYAWGYSSGVSHEASRVKAAAAVSASVNAARNPPSELYCPESDSDQYKAAITALPVVEIKDPPARAVIVIHTDVVVLVEAKVTGNLVVCGNDASVALTVPLADSAQVYVQGGHTATKPGIGPAIFLVDDVKMPDAARVWFSNHKVQIIRCYQNTKQAPDRPRPCNSYYSTVLPSPSPSAKATR